MNTLMVKAFYIRGKGRQFFMYCLKQYSRNIGNMQLKKNLHPKNVLYTAIVDTVLYLQSILFISLSAYDCEIQKLPYAFKT